jgi:NAD(P)-dependent dehydrogenase (short-subunit alcohol dehydrogenase family)
MSRRRFAVGDFRDKVALVTGGGSGIGRATALAFARRGASIVVADSSSPGGHGTVDLIQHAGGDAMFIQTDVASAADVAAMVNKTVSTYGRLDFAHNNAGVGGFALTADWTEEEWDRVIDVNLKGVWLCMKYEIIQMLSQGYGAIVNTAAAVVLKPMAGSCAYGASKAGILQLTKTAALEYAGRGIRINAIAPSGTRTPMLEGLKYSKPPVESKPYPIGRIAEPEEIAEAVLWLCSDSASFSVGSCLTLDGGWSMM